MKLLRRVLPAMALLVSALMLVFTLTAHASPGDGFPTNRGDGSLTTGEGSPGGGGSTGGSESPGGSGAGGNGSGDPTGPTAQPGVPGGEAPMPQIGKSVPRVMLTAFTTEPASIRAGEAFRVSFTLQNMSATTRVNNLKVTVSGGEDGAFLPLGGSSSTFIRTMGAEGSVSREMDFRSLPTVEARPYQMTLTVEYEDSDFNQLQSQEVVSVIFEQESRADTSSFQVIPEFVTAGQDASVSFAVNNMGKTKLFNTRASVKPGQSITGQEVFIGNIEPGASGSVDMLVRAEEETFDPTTVMITWEDAAGSPTTVEKTFELVVEPEMVMPEEEFPGEWENEDVAPGPSLSTLALIGGIVLLAILVLALTIRSRRRRRSKQTLDDDMALLDGDPLVPADPK